MIDEISLFLKDWQATYTVVVLYLIINGSIKKVASALRFHRHHDESGMPINSNGKELFPDGKI